MKTRIYAGVDAGSRAIKLVILDADAGTILTHAVADQSLHQAQKIEDLMHATLASAGLTMKDLGGTVATGYGRNLVAFADSTVTEITCHARGALFLAPCARTVVDIGGQDSKLIRLNASGRVHDFVMNDRCAAGTGRFLEIVAQRLEMDLAGDVAAAGASVSPAVISSMCVVFAETEIIGLLVAGEKPAGIFAGVQNAVAARILAMAGRQVQEPVVFTGGVARIAGMAAALERTLMCKIQSVESPQLAGALGAALMAADGGGRP